MAETEIDKRERNNAAAARWRAKNPRTPEQRTAMLAYQKEWRNKNRERLSVDAKAYHAENKDKWRRYRDADPEGYRRRKAENARRYRQSNPDKVSEAKRLYYEKNKEHVHAKAAEWRRNNPERRKAIAIQWNRRNPEARKDAQLRCVYGIGLDDYRRMVDAQEGKCLICARRKKLVVDHCHETGTVRGLLCFGCNGAIGKLGDTATTVARAVAYLASVEQRKVVACA